MIRDQRIELFHTIIREELFNVVACSSSMSAVLHRQWSITGTDERRTAIGRPRSTALRSDVYQFATFLQLNRDYRDYSPVTLGTEE